jgi:hypothetical protein
VLASGESGVIWPPRASIQVWAVGCAQDFIKGIHRVLAAKGEVTICGHSREFFVKFAEQLAQLRRPGISEGQALGVVGVNQLALFAFVSPKSFVGETNRIGDMVLHDGAPSSESGYAIGTNDVEMTRKMERCMFIQLRKC